eukprot:g1005.t1
MARKPPGPADEDSPFVQALCGIAGQVFSSSITYPLDVIKTRVQTSMAQAGAGAVVDDSFFGMLSTILEESGWAGLYHGVDGEMYKESLKSFVYFYVYVYLKKEMARDGEPLGVGRNLVAGMLSAAAGQLVNTPLNVAHTRMVAGTSDKGFIGTIVDVHRQGGLQELYSGILPSLILTCNPAINYTVNDQAKSAYLAYKARARRAIGDAGASAGEGEGEAEGADGRGGEVELTALEAFAIGVVAKTTSTVLTYPLIRAKVVLQSNVTDYTATLPVLLMLLRTEGVFGVYKGLKPQLIRAIFGGALLLMGKEKIQQAVRRVVAAKGSGK